MRNEAPSDPIWPGEEGLTPDQRRDMDRIRRQMKKARDTGSRVEEIKAKCLECVGGKWREVRECPCQQCPLWNHRMGAASRSIGIVEKGNHKAEC